MKNLALSLLLLGTFSASAADSKDKEKKGDWHDGVERDSVQAILEKLGGKTVTLFLQNGQTITGVLGTSEVSSQVIQTVVLTTIEGREKYSFAVSKQNIIGVSARKGN